MFPMMFNFKMNHPNDKLVLEWALAVIQAATVEDLEGLHWPPEEWDKRQKLTVDDIELISEYDPNNYYWYFVARWRQGSNRLWVTWTLGHDLVDILRSLAHFSKTGELS